MDFEDVQENFELVSPDKLVVDETNPNSMDVNTFTSLKKSILKFGMMMPIITNSEYLIADGFHRWKASKELSLEKIPILKLDVDEVDRRMLRQIMNKLRGSHDKSKDLDEFLFIKEHGNFDLFKGLLSNEEKAIDNLMEFKKEKELDVKDDDVNKVSQLGKHVITCPSCSHKFQKE